MLLPFEEVELDVGFDDSLAALVLDRLCEQLHESIGLDIFMNVEEALLDDILLSVLCDDLLMQSFLLGVLYYVLHPHRLLAIVCKVLDIFVEKIPDDMFCCLKAIVLDQIIHNQLVQIEKMPK